MMLKMCIIALRFHKSSFDAQNKVCTSRESARHLLVKMVQEETMGKVIRIMRDSKLIFEEALQRFPPSERTSSLPQLVKYIPFLDGNGILRIGGRLSQCDLAYNFKQPIILPPRHWVTFLYVRKKHKNMCHLGPDLVFGGLQQDLGLWVMGKTGTERFYTKDCLGCKLVRQNRGEQLMAPLPSYRVKPRCCVFTYVAADLAGPFGVSVGRSTLKRWLCVFVCLVTTPYE